MVFWVGEGLNFCFVALGQFPANPRHVIEGNYKGLIMWKLYKRE